MRHRLCFPILLILLGQAAVLPAAQTVYPTGTTIWDQGRSYDGYTLFREIGGSVVLIDMDGTLVHSWVNPDPSGVLFNVTPLDQGHILVYGADASNLVRRSAAELDHLGNPVWSYELPASEPLSTVLHHDIKRFPNGNTLLLGYRDVQVPSISSEVLRDDFLMEVDAAGTVLRQWESWRRFDDFQFPDDQKAQIAATGGDWAHLNSAFFLPANRHTDPAFRAGNVLLSYRHLNTICIIDQTSGEIVWKIGPGPDHKTHGQHTAYMIEEGLPGAGNILLFDNGCGTGWCHEHPSPGLSRVIEINPVSKAIVWQFNEGRRFYSDIVSGAQRLPNGNTLICSGVRGRLFEVRPNGELVWEYMSPYFTQQGFVKKTRIFRAYRLPYDWLPSSSR